ncbi:sporulation initiation inhibitor Soj [Desulfosarcina widdelii]|uniref:Sporulation initiation inhibitor Soj n=1 Tax=Desulfosarcina widdelii TaxID=947919 RepID=A0A5K7Z2S6_9BACT|nr:ParA family protein [Desulfosarcina widdelii]BBO73821.1 sporulation initiation inhibitor Soj [Desulfosarcina widdelii]
MGMRKIAVAMAKGGVGKTTTAVNLAHGLALAGKRVLLVDCDTQAQTTTFLGVSPPHGLYEFITGRDGNGKTVLKKEAIFPARQNLWVLAGGIQLVELKHWLGEQPRDQRHAVLRHSLTPKNNGLDYLIFDCAPGWDVLSVNILMAVQEVLCPVALQGPAVEGLKTFFGYLISVQQLNQSLRLKYILPTMFDRRTRQSRDIYNQLRRLFRKQICSPIYHNVRLCEAPGNGKSIFEYDNNATGAKDYRKLAERLIDDAIRRQDHPGLF